MDQWSPAELSRLTNVSVRTLHLYDEMDLLKPSMRLPNGYRFYSESDLSKLQQIIALKFFGFKLAKIKVLLAQHNDNLAHFQAQKNALKTQMSYMENAMDTLDDIISQLKSNRSINWQEIIELIEDYNMTQEIEKFWGFELAQQTEYEKYLVNQGIVSQADLDKGRQKYQSWKKEDWRKIKVDGDEINNALLEALQKNLKSSSSEVQNIIKKHFEWVNIFWTPNHEKYISLGKMYCENPDFRKYYDNMHPALAQFLADAMKVYADKHLK